MTTQEQNQVMIGVINMDITTFRQDAFDENNQKIKIDSTGLTKKMLELPNKDPYQNLQTLVIAPLQKQVKQVDGESVSFIFGKTSFLFSTNPIKELQIDFGNGQISEILSNRAYINTTITHSFTSGGTKRLIFTGVFQDGTTFETYGMISVALIDTISPPEDAALKLRATESFTPYIPDELPSNFIPGNLFAEIEYEVNYSTNPPRTEIIKPIIITDGIDYGDVRNCKFIFDNTLDLPEIDGNLGKTLQAQGYDVIIVNFPTYVIGTREIMTNVEVDDYGNPVSWDMETIEFKRKGGADYIQRNALAVKQLIRVINDELTANSSDEELVVVGPSMGGLVTRWALKEMEDDGEDHNTRLWVSFDAPHQGANGPTSLQDISAFFGITSLTDMLNRSASKQMLVHHYLAEEQIPIPAYPYLTYGLISEGAPGFRNRFQNELDALGYPEDLRKVALVNGSTRGTEINTAGEEIAHLHFKIDTWFWDHNFIDFTASFTKNQGETQVVDADIDIPWYPPIYNLEISLHKYTQTNANIGSYDNAPGSFISSDIDTSINGIYILDTNNGLDDNWGIDVGASLNANSYSFMPTKSTLDFQGDPKLRTKFCNRDLTELGETPFDSYYTPYQNQPHVELNTYNVNWLLNELNETPDPPSITCIDYNFEIVEINRPCNYNEGTYTTINEDGLPMEVNWNYSD